jgi:hypothetical protein
MLRTNRVKPRKDLETPVSLDFETDAAKPCKGGANETSSGTHRGRAIREHILPFLSPNKPSFSEERKL